VWKVKSLFQSDAMPVALLPVDDGADGFCYQAILKMTSE
jgi:hypothetical protein